MITQKDFTYNSGITVVSEKQFNVHKGLYQGYVTKTNEIDEKFKTASKVGNATYSEFRGLKLGYSYAVSGVILHELYFENLGGGQIAASFEDITKKRYTSYQNWKDDFTATAMSARGWVIFGYEQRTDSFVNVLLDTHDVGNIPCLYPIIVLDMYEHAYYVDYASDKAKYIANFIDNIKWNVVEERLGAVNF